MTSGRDCTLLGKGKRGDLYQRLAICAIKQFDRRGERMAYYLPFLSHEAQNLSSPKLSKSSY